MTLANRYSQRKTQDLTTHNSVSVKMCEEAKERSQDSAGEQVLTPLLTAGRNKPDSGSIIIEVFF